MIRFEWTAAKFFWYLFFGYVTMLYFTFYGMMSIGLTRSYNIAATVSSGLCSIWNLFSGVIVPRPVRPHLVMPHLPCTLFFPTVSKLLVKLIYLQKVPI
jgi:hypothetical protein